LRFGRGTAWLGINVREKKERQYCGFDTQVCRFIDKGLGISKRTVFYSAEFPHLDNQIFSAVEFCETDNYIRFRVFEFSTSKCPVKNIIIVRRARKTLRVRHCRPLFVLQPHRPGLPQRPTLVSFLFPPRSPEVQRTNRIHIDCMLCSNRLVSKYTSPENRAIIVARVSINC
jgi:hypothetical protein